MHRASITESGVCFLVLCVIVSVFGVWSFGGLAGLSCSVDKIGADNCVVCECFVV